MDIRILDRLALSAAIVDTFSETKASWFKYYIVASVKILKQKKQLAAIHAGCPI